MRVFILAVMTADGFIARGTDEFSMDWASKEDERLFVRLTKEAGVIVMGSATAQTVIEAGRRLPGRRKLVYTRQPGKITAEGFEPTAEAPRDLIARLSSEGARAVAVCGGAQIYSLFLQAGVVDELYVTIEPKLFGRGVPLLNDAFDADLQLLSVDKLNDNTVLLHYAVLS